MDKKAEILKLFNEYAVQFDSTNLDTVIEKRDFNELAEEVVKLFLIPPVSGQVCEHPLRNREHYEGSEMFKCWKCGKIV